MSMEAALRFSIGVWLEDRGWLRVGESLIENAFLRHQYRDLNRIRAFPLFNFLHISIVRRFYETPSSCRIRVSCDFARRRPR